MVAQNSATWLLILFFISAANSAPQSINQNPKPITIPFTSRSSFTTHDHSVTQWRSLSSSLSRKYLPTSGFERRLLVTASMTNHGADTSYVGTIQLGTPPKPYNVILDTGSSDLWLSSSECTRCLAVASGALFDTSSSSTFQPLDGTFNASYGSGDVIGTLGEDAITFGEFRVPNQEFGLATTIENDFMTGNVSGIMGLAFQAVSSTGTTPWWISATAYWTTPQMSFYFTRFRNQDGDKGADAPGGQFTLGGTNSSLYDGAINYIDLVEAKYWTIPLQGLGLLGGGNIALNGSIANAVIDTGTTFIAGPASVLDQFYSQIPGSALATDLDSSLAGYYVIPCDANVQATLTFGGQSYTMAASDMIGGTVSDDHCLGTFFTLELNHHASPLAPTWIIGAAFLKNVYSVFQFDPPAVGFANLKDDIESFGDLGRSGFSIDEYGTTTGSIVHSSASRRSLIFHSIWVVLALCLMEVLRAGSSF